MAAHAESLLYHLQRLTGQSNTDAEDDATLLQRFVVGRDETPFAVLLARHGPMVHGVCRRILRDNHEAEDVFQAVFLLLARKAGALRHPEALAAWLYGAARRLALMARRSNTRRRQREKERAASASVALNPLDEFSAREFLSAVEEELARLPERYRLPLILCGLEGRSQAEAARLLGWTAGSVKNRLERGRARLRVRLVRRGLTVSAGLLALESLATAPVSADLRQATVRKALTFADGSAKGVAANVVALAETEVTRRTTQVKLGLGFLLTVGLAAGASTLISPVPTQKPVAAKQGKAPPGAKPETARQVRTDRYGDPLPPGALMRLGSTRLRYNSSVDALAFAPDGKSVLCGGFSQRAFLFDVATGKRLRAFQQRTLKSLAIDPQGKTVALAGYSEGSVKRFELATGKELPTIQGHPKGIEVVAFSPDGKLLATGGKDKKIGLWNAATARGIDSWPADSVSMPSLRFTPDGKSLAYLDEDGALRFRDVATGTERKPLGSLVDARIYAFVFAEDGRRLITGSASDASSLQLWDIASGKEIRTIARTQGRTGFIFLAPDGKSIWTAAYDPQLRTIHVFQWDLASGKQLMHLFSSSERLRSFALSPDGKCLAAGDMEGNVFLWDTKKGRKTHNFIGHKAMATGAVFTPDGRQVWTGAQDATLRLWSASSGEQLHQFSTANNNDHTYDLAIRPDGKVLAMAVLRRTNNPATEKCDVRLWDLTTNTEGEPLRGHGGWVDSVAFSLDGKTIASHSEDLTIRLWDVATGKQRHELRVGLAQGKGVCFTPDGSRLIGSLDPNTIGFWDVDNGRLVRRLFAGPSGGIHIPLLSSNGRSLLVGGFKQPLRLLEVASGKERYCFEKSNTGGYAVAALSPDNRILAASAPGGESIQLWNLMTGEPLGKLDVGAAWSSPLRMTFSPDSRLLASPLFDGTTLIWDVSRLSPSLGAEKHLTAPRLEELWKELASENAATANRAIWALTTTPHPSLPFLRQRLADVANIPVDRAKIARFLTDLDSAEFAAREKASQGLQGLGMVAEPAMRRALAEKPSLEVRRRLEQLLDKLESGARPSDELRIVRTFEVLELIGSAEARQVLYERSLGIPESWLTREAKAVLRTLAARP